jgi:Carboxypeptidase regulatory-like domain
VRTKITFRIAFLGLLMAVTSFALTTLAQNYRGAVRGRVTDPRGASIPGAQLKLIEQETNEVRIVKTDGNGDFTISLLRPGYYRLEVESEGFLKYSNTISLQVNQDIRLDVALKLPTIKVDENMIVAPVSPLKY